MNAIELQPKTWTPAVPCKAPDNLISSDYTTAKMFMPSYEKERRPCIERLLSNDYQRIWWQEKQIWDKTYTREVPSKKILPRMLIKRKVRTCKTVKYQVVTDRFKGNKKTTIKQKSSEKSKTEDTKQKEKTKECEESKLKKHEQTKVEEREEDLKDYKSEIKSEKNEETIEKREEKDLEECEEVK